MENHTLEISSICVELEKLALSGVFSERTAGACEQAASLLKTLRATVFERVAETAIVETLRQLLIDQGEG